MKLLQLCLSPDYGGLELYFRDFARWLETSGESVCLGLRTGSPLDRDLSDVGTSRIEFSDRASVLPLLSARRLARFVDQHKVDIVHVHWKYDLALVALAKKFARRRIRLVHSRHMDMPGSKRDPYHRFIYGSVDLYHAVTHAVGRQAEANLGMPADRIVVIHPGARSEFDAGDTRPGPDAREPYTERPFTVGVIGRVSAYKAQHLLIEALAALHQEGCSVRGRIIGAPESDAYTGELAALAADLGLGPVMAIEPFCQDVPGALHQLDVLALTTIKETFGTVLVEGMLAGLPVVGSNAGGVPEIIDDGETGLLFEPGSAASLAAALRTLYDDRALAQRLARAGQAKARGQFSQERQFERVLDALRCVIKEP